MADRREPLDAEVREELAHGGGLGWEVAAQHEVGRDHAEPGGEQRSEAAPHGDVDGPAVQQEHDLAVAIVQVRELAERRRDALHR